MRSRNTQCASCVFSKDPGSGSCIFRINAKDACCVSLEGRGSASCVCRKNTGRTHVLSDGCCSHETCFCRFRFHSFFMQGSARGRQPLAASSRNPLVVFKLRFEIGVQLNCDLLSTRMRVESGGYPHFSIFSLFFFHHFFFFKRFLSLFFIFQRKLINKSQ